MAIMILPTQKNWWFVQSFNGNGATAMDRRGREKLGGASAWNQICQTCCMLHVRIHVKLVARSKSCQWSIPWLLPGLSCWTHKGAFCISCYVSTCWTLCAFHGRHPYFIYISIPLDLYSVVMGRHFSEDPAKDHRVWRSGVSKQFDAGWALMLFGARRL